MDKAKRHPQHPGGAWPLNVEMNPSPVVILSNEGHPDDVEQARKDAEADAVARREAEQAADEEQRTNPRVAGASTEPAKGKQGKAKE